MSDFARSDEVKSRTRLAILILAVEDLDRAVRFYDAAFGWPREIDTPVYVEYRLPKELRLGLYERQSFGINTGQVPARVPEGELRGTEIYLYADDIQAAIERLEAAGARVLSPLAGRNWGDEAAYFADPDGNVLVLARPLNA